MRRTKDFNELLSKKMQKKSFASNYLLALMEGEEGLSVVDALKEMIEVMGIKEFSKLAKIPSPNIVEFLKGRRHPKPATLDHYLKPFGLKTLLTVTKAA